MGLSKAQREALYAALHDVREQELDCDEYLVRLPADVEGRLADVTVNAAMRHHREVCPECDEERDILRRALGLDARNRTETET